MSSYWTEIVNGGWTLVEGMRVTLKRLFQPVVTVQYPRDRVVLSPAYRGHIELKRFEETGTHKCISCMTCERTCPSGVISIKSEKKEAKGPKTLTGYTIDFSKCSLCGLCVESCPTETLQYSTEYEMAGERRSESRIDLMKRLEESKA